MSDQNSRFAPRVNDRTPSGSWFAEFFPLPGPEDIGEPRSGSRRDRYGWNWLVLLTQGLVPQAWQELPPGSGNWVRQEADLPPIFGTALPTGSRRLTAVFDQAARLIVAYEHGEQVLITRWDDDLQQYVQNVTFPGVNPALTTDAHAGIPIGDSDVLVYYQPPDNLAEIRARVQRELYLTEHTVYAGNEPLILDRAHITILPQLFVSGTDGLPLYNAAGELEVLAGPLYPFTARDGVMLSAGVVPARMEAYTYLTEGVDRIMLAGTVINNEGYTGQPHTMSTPRVPSGSPPTALTNLRILHGEVTATYPRLSSTAFPQCVTVEDSVPAPEWGIGASHAERGSGTNNGFDVVLLSERILDERYGISGVTGFLRVNWQPLTTTDLAAMPEYDGQNSAGTACVTAATWQARDRTLIVEVGYASDDDPLAATWHEVYRYTAQPSTDPEWTWGIREHGFTVDDYHLLSSLRSAWAFVRVRTLEPGGQPNSTGAWLLGGHTVMLHALTNRYVSNTLQVRPRDQVMLTAQVVPARYEDTVRQFDAEDDITLAAAAVDGEYVRYIAHRATPQDHVMLQAGIITGEYREV